MIGSSFLRRFSSRWPFLSVSPPLHCRASVITALGEQGRLGEEGNEMSLNFVFAHLVSFLSSGF